MINEKMKSLGEESSIIRQLFEEGKKLKKSCGDDAVFDFSIGNPSIPCPDEVNDAITFVTKNMDSVKLHGYTSAQGDENTRKAISCYLNKTYDAKTDPNLIYLTLGAAAALTISLKAIVNPGDEVIVIAPFFPEYKVFIENAGGIVKIISSDLSTFLPDYEMLSKEISEKTKAVIINSPNNPTGVVYKEEDIKNISKILNEKQKYYNHDIYLISDEPYRELIYSDVKYPFVTNYYDNTIVAYSFSKSLSLPGERIGYVLLTKSMKEYQDVYKAICGSARSLGFVCASSLFQYVIPYCLGKTSNISIYKTNRDILYDALTNFGYEVVKSEGAFYMFARSLEKDSNNFSKIAKKFKLLLVPSDSFGLEGFVRISYCVSLKQIKDSLEAFKALIAYYKKVS